MTRLLIAGVIAAMTLLLSGCGEDSATEPRFNFITVINATETEIQAYIFNNMIKTLQPKSAVDDTYDGISEAPSVWYTAAGVSGDIGEETISQGDLINAYVAADCTNDGGTLRNHIYHTPPAGSINIVNTTDDHFTFDVAGTETYIPACGYEEFPNASLSGEDNVTVSYGGETISVPLPKNGEVFDLLIFGAYPNYTFQKYDIKAFKG